MVEVKSPDSFIVELMNSLFAGLDEIVQWCSSTGPPCPSERQKVKLTGMIVIYALAIRRSELHGPNVVCFLIHTYDLVWGPLQFSRFQYLVMDIREDCKDKKREPEEAHCNRAHIIGGEPTMYERPGKNERPQHIVRASPLLKCYPKSLIRHAYDYVQN